MTRDERGSVTAEFAVVVPAVVLVIVLAVSAMSVGARQVRLEQGAAQAARLAARGEAADRIARAGAIVSGARVSVFPDGDFVCATLTAPAGVALPLADLRARSCALAGAGPGGRNGAGDGSGGDR